MLHRTTFNVNSQCKFDTEQIKLRVTVPHSHHDQARSQGFTA